VKAISKRLLLLSALLGLSMLPAQANSAETFQRLVTQPDYRQRQENRVLEEVKRWQANPQPLPDALWQNTRQHFNLSPRHAVFRPALLRMLQTRKPAAGQSQAEELHYYQLLNLEPRNAQYRERLATLLYQKHGGHSVAEVKQAYQRLNEAFNTWDKKQYDQALRLFKQAHLPRSPELTAIYAAHLRDRGQFNEARKVLVDFTGPRGYLNWIDGSLKEMETSQSIVNGAYIEADKLAARIHLGQLAVADTAIKGLPAGAMKHWHRAKWHEKQAGYHPASAEYLQYYRQRWASQLPGFVPVVYKAQLEDVNSLDLIALKFRTSPELIRQVNQDWPHDWVETYRMLVIPVAPHELKWPTTGYVSSHFGYRLHPIRGTWRLHEGIDIETLPGVKAQAAAPGTVMQAGYDQACGNMIRMQHPQPELRTLFCHGDKLLAQKGAKLQAGQDVLVTGNTGASASNHLHFSVQLNGVYTDPMDWL